MNTTNITNYKPKDFAELLGVSVKTLQRWDRDGILKANRTPTDRRYYTYDQYLQFKGIQTDNDIRDVVIYARVSTESVTVQLSAGKLHFFAVAERHMTKNSKILLCKQASTPYFTVFCRMAELLPKSSRIFETIL